MLRAILFVCTSSFLFLVHTGCKRTSPHASPSSSPDAAQNVAEANVVIDACSLITKEEIQAVQGSSVTEAKSSENSDGVFRVSQCYYATSESDKSVSLAVTESAGAGKATPKAFWQKTFGPLSGQEKESQVDKEKKESVRGPTKGREEVERESAPPRKVDGIGEAAFWAANRVGGALYVLKGDIFFRISVGGGDNEETKLDKSKALAQKALSRL